MPVTPMGSGPLVLQIFWNKQTEFPVKNGLYLGKKPCKLNLETKHSIYRYITTQRPHAGVHSSTGYTPGVHNQP